MPKSWWIETGQDLADEIIDHTVNDGLDVNDRKFKPLNSEYATRKADGSIRRAGKQRAVANLWLTGDMMSSLKYIRATLKSVVIGWSPFESEKLRGNAKNGRHVTVKKKAISKRVAKSLQKWIDRQTQKNIKKNDTVNVIRLGKR